MLWESQFGSETIRRLIIEEKTKELRRIRVTEDIYTNAEAGMWFRTDKSGFKLTSPPDIDEWRDRNEPTR
jgi:hypothetical protein